MDVSKIEYKGDTTECLYCKQRFPDDEAGPILTVFWANNGNMNEWTGFAAHQECYDGYWHGNGVPNLKEPID